MIPHEENAGILIDAWKLMVGRLPGGEIRHADGVATMFAHVPMPFLNLSALDQPFLNPSGLSHALALAKERARNCEFGTLIGLCDAWAPPDYEHVAAAQGLVPELRMTGMAADRLLPPRRAAPGLEFRRIATDAAARDLATINAQAYQLSWEMFECMCNLHFWHQDSFGYVGYLNGRAVSCASTFPVAGTTYVAFVATLPDAYGKGYAEAVMRHAIAQTELAAGPRRLTLHASPMGRSLYQAMGFESGAQIVLLAPAVSAVSR